MEFVLLRAMCTFLNYLQIHRKNFKLKKTKVFWFMLNRVFTTKLKSNTKTEYFSERKFLLNSHLFKIDNEKNLRCCMIVVDELHNTFTDYGQTQNDTGTFDWCTFILVISYDNSWECISEILSTAKIIE